MNIAFLPPTVYAFGEKYEIERMKRREQGGKDLCRVTERKSDEDG